MKALYLFIDFGYRSGYKGLDCARRVEVEERRVPEIRGGRFKNKKTVYRVDL